MEDLKKALEIKDEKERMKKVDEILGPQLSDCQRRYYQETKTDGSCVDTGGIAVQNCVDITNCADPSDNRTVCSDWHCG